MDKKKLFTNYFNKEVIAHCVIGTQATGNKLYCVTFADGTTEKVWMNFKNPDVATKELMNKSK